MTGSAVFNLDHLGLTITPQRYLDAVHRMHEAGETPGDNKDAFWQMLPAYLVARCPVCGKAYTEAIDTYSLFWWDRPWEGKEVFWGNKHMQRCEHCFLVHPFIHLNGHTPSRSDTELAQSTTFIAETPHVIPIILGKDTSCQAVIHSLPICRIEDNRFVPRYTLYMLSYFAKEKEHQSLRQRILDFLDGMEDYHSLLVYPFPSRVKTQDADLWWNLDHWVEQGKLLWLEPDTPDLPLHAAPAERFPYGGIEGRRMPYAVTLPPRENRQRSLRQR